MLLLITLAQALPLSGILNPPELDGATVCATVTDDTGRLLFNQNGSQRVSPASNEKLFSAAFALYELGPTYTPITSIWKLADRVVVDSPGDPAMSHEDLISAAHKLDLNRRLPVYVKQAYDPEIPDGWEFGDLPNRYAAPVSAFSVDQGGFELWNADGQPQLRPESYGVAITKERTKESDTYSYDPTKGVLKMRKALPKKTSLLDTLAVPSGTGAAASVLGSDWKPASELPSSPPSLTITGKPLSEVLTRCLQHSDNIMAENLLLMGACHEHPLNPSNPYPEALTDLSNFETRVVGLPSGDLVPKDGSGLTESNMVTTRALTQLLNWEQGQATGALWISALASPGVGTLSNRLKGVSFHGKTGSLSHVTALSGYLTDTKGHKFTVSVIINKFTCSERRAREVIDRFVKFISDNGV